MTTGLPGERVKKGGGVVRRSGEEKGRSREQGEGRREVMEKCYYMNNESLTLSSETIGPSHTQGHEQQRDS